MTHLTVVFWDRTSVGMCRNLIRTMQHRIIWENPHIHRFNIEVPAGEEAACASRYKAFTAVRTVFYAVGGEQ